MKIKLRPSTPDDALRCGTICYEAFTVIANQHNFPPDLPSTEVTVGLISKLIANPRFYGIVAEIGAFLPSVLYNACCSVALSETDLRAWTCNGVPGGCAASVLIQLR